MSSDSGNTPSPETQEKRKAKSDVLKTGQLGPSWVLWNADNASKPDTSDADLISYDPENEVHKLINWRALQRPNRLHRPKSLMLKVFSHGPDSAQTSYNNQKQA